MARHWAAFLGVAPESLAEPGVRIVEHVPEGLAGYAGVWVFRHRECVLVSVPPGRTADLGPALAGLATHEAGSAAAVAGALAALPGLRVDRAIGPSYQGWLPPAAFRPAPHRGARPLEAGDAPALAALEGAVSAEERAHADLSAGTRDLVGVFAAGRLLAAAGLRWSEPDVCDPGVLTHPAHRARGLGAAAVSAAVAPALERDALVLYQTLLGNAPALAAARRLGFEEFAQVVAVRLGDAGD